MRNLINEIPSDKLEGRNLALKKFIGVNNIKNKTILDIGCGFGWFEYCFQDKAKKIIAIDIDKKNLLKCKKQINSKNIEFIFGDGLSIPMKENSVDVVVASEVIEHLSKGSEDIFLREIKRVLKKDGVIYLTTPFESFWSNLTDPAWWLIGHRHYSLNKMLNLLNQNDLVLVKKRVFGKWWTLLSLLNMYVTKWIFRRKKFFENFFNEKERMESLDNNGFMNLFLCFRKK